MQDTEFYRELLGIKEPWYVREVELDSKRMRVDVYIEHRDRIRFSCPECGSYYSVYDHKKEREIRHLNTCDMATYIHVRFPRIECPEHGVRQIINEWGGENSEITYKLESFLIDLEKECAIESVSRITGLHWHTCWDVMERSVERGLRRRPWRIPERIGIDEKSFSKGHKYESLVYDIDRGTVEDVCDNRDQESLEGYYKQFTKEERACVKSVAMDMWDPYIAATRAYIPDADKKIVFDKFHVMCGLNESVDKVRKEEHKELMSEGIDLLKGTKYIWLWDKKNIPSSRRWEFNVLRKINIKTSRAWAIKENFKNFWNYTYEGSANKFFRRWYFWATHSRLQPVINAAKTIKRHFGNILTYLKHHITNALGESLNSKIEKVKRMACGYRNRKHYRIAIFFHCGGLDLYPIKA